jgi:hypothetical protein
LLRLKRNSIHDASISAENIGWNVAPVAFGAGSVAAAGVVSILAAMQHPT